MSLYGFGKLVCSERNMPAVRQFITPIAMSKGFAINWDIIDDEDRMTLDSVPELSGDGMYFALHSSPAESDATALWIEATRCWRTPSVVNAEGAPSAVERRNGVQSALRNTRLARALMALAEVPDCRAAGIALVDGSVDEVIRVDRGNCVDTILRDTRVPWDQGPNRLYVWTLRGEP
jgi:hypothetical protein